VSSDPGDIPALTAALEDSSPVIRAEAIDGLAAHNTAAVAPAIAELAKKDRSVFVRKTGCYALGRIDGYDATAALAGCLRDKDPEVRGAGAVAFSAKPDASAVHPLISALRDKSDFVRAHAATALGALGPAAVAAVPELVRILSKDSYAEARREAASALGTIGDRSAIPALDEAGHSVDPYLSQAARDALAQINHRPSGK
jgi:HEAT repeat protein